MAADQGRPHVFSSALKSPTHVHVSSINEGALHVTRQGAGAADLKAAALSSYDSAVAGTPSSSPQSGIYRMRTTIGAGPHGSVFHEPGTEVGRELDYALILSTSDAQHVGTSAHSYTRICNSCCSTSMATRRFAAPLRDSATAVDTEVGSILVPGEKTSSSKLKRVHELLNAATTDEVDQAENEEGYVTPTARDQRIPRYGLEVNALLCPPAPKKKARASKRRCTPSFYFANAGDGVIGVAARTATADNFNSRAFLVEPPDLHNFPDCIRALFK